MRLIYFLLTVFTFIVLFQIFWPLILVFGLFIVGIFAYLNYKAKQAFKNSDQTGYYESQSNEQPTFQNPYQQEDDSNIEKPVNTGNVIDAEYTERSQNDDRN
ncbi:hypothetical protein [Anaerorhabdus furcosa]|uniref:Uncharacterized protein n=1 Tax=Anaerorhabdus furcosa TaxID=118967 RepID=A0A1T4KJG7_9FIRM|nr:hypothetical protein [Anaerorhabdus furcosa]SJZ42526.1 hypothetical protein SAMN02745191_0565 [Anaerorhabdus furcosa]